MVFTHQRLGKASMHKQPQQIARCILTGFDRHFSVFREITGEARGRFERADWTAAREALAKRVSFYDKRVTEAIEKLRSTFDLSQFDEVLWQKVKAIYIELLRRHNRPELAETFYNSVFCQMFERQYFNNDMIFVESLANRPALTERYPGYMSFHPRKGDVAGAVWEILSAFYFSLPYEDIERDSRHIAAAFIARSPLGGAPLDELEIEVLESAFFRNKAAYLIGRVIHGSQVEPFAIALLNNENGAIFADTLLTTHEQMDAMFSFARAYFMVKSPVPAATIDFLQSIMPQKSLSELYMSIGFHKQAKNEFYRDFLHHLRNSQDPFVIAPGTRGLVMSVFTLPSYPYVFKVIRDHFPPQKQVTHALIKKRYLQVKKHDRVGRMADTLEFSDVAFPRQRFSPELMAELTQSAPSLLEIEEDVIIVKHLFLERRMTPLDLFLQQADDENIQNAVIDWGLSIRQLMAVNIFPGDLLFKNFGVTCQGKVVFYDYDEICYLTECNFRRIPPARFPEDEMSGEPWYSIGPHDVFPEEFLTFLTSSGKIRRILRQHHADLFDYRYWQKHQQAVGNGLYLDVLPYCQEIRFARPPAMPLLATAAP
jgi:isocitrate dehydrogenase kinase/phosphatase